VVHAEAGLPDPPNRRAGLGPAQLPRCSGEGMGGGDRGSWGRNWRGGPAFLLVHPPPKRVYSILVYLIVGYPPRPEASAAGPPLKVWRGVGWPGGRGGGEGGRAVPHSHTHQLEPVGQTARSLSLVRGVDPSCPALPHMEPNSNPVMTRAFLKAKGPPSSG